MKIQQLEKAFAFSNKNGELKFTFKNNNYPIIEVKNKLCKAQIALQGAHLLGWQKSMGEDVIWLSKEATFEVGKSIRGGIPVCWPWFGAHSTQATFPAHGFARTEFWEIASVVQLSDSKTKVNFILDTQKLDCSTKYWPWPTQLEYSMTLSDILELELKTINTSNETITISEALHSYFNVDDIYQTKVTGLDSKYYYDKPDNFKKKLQSGAITFNAEVDRVYINTDGKVAISNPSNQIMITTEGSYSTVVWNPWQEVALKMGDLGEKGYLKMLCVESANAMDNAVILKPADSHTLKASYYIR